MLSFPRRATGVESRCDVRGGVWRGVVLRYIRASGACGRKEGTALPVGDQFTLHTCVRLIDSWMFTHVCATHAPGLRGMVSTCFEACCPVPDAMNKPRSANESLKLHPAINPSFSRVHFKSVSDLHQHQLCVALSLV